jgi:adenine phosphoribosyltransferase
MSLEILKQSILNASVVKKGKYSYIVHPITDGVPEISSLLLKEVTNGIKKKLEKYNNIDKIVTIEAMGIPLASVLSVETGIPFTIIRKRKYNLPDEISVEQFTGYSKSQLFINGLNKGDNVVIVDDVLSTGGTLKAVLSALNKIDVNVLCVIIAVNKGKFITKIMEESKVKITTLVNIEVIDDKVVIK